MSGRSRWARSLIERAEKPIPAYGSPAWLALPEGSPAKVAAVVIAAECWATELDDLEAVTLLEVEAHKATDDSDYAARAEAHRTAWQHLPRVATRAARAKAARRETYGERYGVAS